MKVTPIEIASMNRELISESRKCDTCAHYFETYFTIEIDGMKVGRYCRDHAGDICEGLRQRLGWFPEVYRLKRHECYRMRNVQINNLAKKIEVLY